MSDAACVDGCWFRAAGAIPEEVVGVLPYPAFLANLPMKSLLREQY
jgi:hypothetical protein